MASTRCAASMRTRCPSVRRRAGGDGCFQREAHIREILKADAPASEQLSIANRHESAAGRFDKGAGSVHAAHQAQARQPADRFAYHAARDVETRADVALTWQSIAGRQIAIPNSALDRRGDTADLIGT